MNIASQIFLEKKTSLPNYLLGSKLLLVILVVIADDSIEFKVTIGENFHHIKMPPELRFNYG